MKPIVILAVIVGSSFAAPIEEAEELIRTMRSYGAPCGGAAPYAPVSLYLSPSPQPLYREEEHEEEHHARSNYESSLGGLSGYSGASSGSGLSLGGYGSGVGSGYGSAVGLFPHANTGGCNIPLLLSCAPNVVTGHIVESHGHSGYSAPAYRNMEEEGVKDWAKMARKASHHKVSEDFPEHRPEATGSHHVVSQDFPEPNLTRVVPTPDVDEKTSKL